LPPTNGFVGEFLILAGAFQARPLFAVLATFGTVVAAAYLLAFVGRVFHGPAREALASVGDLRLGEYAVLLPLIAVVFWVGLYPKPLLMRSDMAVQVLLARIHAAAKMDLPAAPGHASSRFAMFDEGIPPTHRGGEVSLSLLRKTPGMSHLFGYGPAEVTGSHARLVSRGRRTPAAGRSLPPWSSAISELRQWGTEGYVR
jgi:hypothetical protein